MRLAGVADRREHGYILDKEKYPAELFSDRQWSYKAVRDSNKFLVKGVNIFSFGDIKLICPKDITPVYLKALKFSMFDKNEDKKLADELKSKARECIPLNKNDVLQWDDNPL